MTRCTECRRLSSGQPAECAHCGAKSLARVSWVLPLVGIVAGIGALSFAIPILIHLVVAAVQAVVSMVVSLFLIVLVIQLLAGPKSTVLQSFCGLIGSLLSLVFGGIGQLVRGGDRGAED